jgi:hypothetical protein
MHELNGPDIQKCSIMWHLYVYCLQRYDHHAAGWWIDAGWWKKKIKVDGRLIVKLATIYVRFDLCVVCGSRFITWSSTWLVHACTHGSLVRTDWGRCMHVTIKFIYMGELLFLKLSWWCFGRKNLDCSGILATLVFWVIFWNSDLTSGIVVILSSTKI